MPFQVATRIGTRGNHHQARLQHSQRQGHGLLRRRQAGLSCQRPPLSDGRLVYTLRNEGQETDQRLPYRQETDCQPESAAMATLLWRQGGMGHWRAH